MNRYQQLKNLKFIVVGSNHLKIRIIFPASSHLAVMESNGTYISQAEILRRHQQDTNLIKTALVTMSSKI